MALAPVPLPERESSTPRMDKAPATLLPPGAHGALLQAQAALLARARLDEAATAFAVELAQIFQCLQVAVAVRRQGALAIVGAAPQGGLDARHEAAALLTAALHEAVDQMQAVAWPALARQDAVVQAQRQLAGAGAALSMPLVDAGQVVGAVAMQRPGAGFSAQEVAQAEDIAAWCGPVLELKRRESRSWPARLREGTAAWLRAPGRRRGVWAAGAVALAAVLAVPVPWRVSAPARLEGSVQRAVVAATDGFLQQANVRAGDRVAAGQVLAELASQDLELERRRRETEVQQHEAAYRAAQARYDRPQMVVHQSKAAEAQALLSLAESQLQRARVVAPFDGIVIKGDLSQSLGAPVQRGEVLMVLAPDTGYRLMLEVDEADIQAIAPGQAGVLALSSQPDAPLAFEVKRIVPVAATGAGRNYFEVEAQVADGAARQSLRPGLSGVAKVRAGWRPIGVLLTRRAWNWLRLAWWSVTP